MQAEQVRVRIRSQRVNVVQHQVLQPRTLRQQPGEHAVAQQVGNLEPVSHRVQALRGQMTFRESLEIYRARLLSGK